MGFGPRSKNAWSSDLTPFSELIGSEISAEVSAYSSMLSIGCASRRSPCTPLLSVREYLDPSLTHRQDMSTVQVEVLGRTEDPGSTLGRRSGDS